jgi:DNA mismatch endonuclease (patch repair protein)
LPGRPDLVFPKFRAVVFVHGCFWHRHSGCRLTTTPATNPAFWQTKFDGNVERDARRIAALRAAGWRVAVVWECSLRGKSVDDIAATVGDWLRSDEAMLELPVTSDRATSHSAME